MMGKEDWVISIKEDEASVKEDRPQVPMRPSIHDWVTRMQEEVDDEVGDSQSQSHSHRHRQQQQQPCIYPVPVWFKALHAGAYEPQAVSIGPYHYGNPKLKPMEKHKHRALLTFLRRAKAPMAAITEAMTAVVEQLKSSYEGLDDLSRYLGTEAEAIEPLAALNKTMKEVLEQLKKSNKGQDDRNRYIDVDSKEQLPLEDRFLQLMIVDGCFILEVLRVAKAVRAKEPSGYEDTDPVFSDHGEYYMMGHLERDMLLLENQLPMLALTTLADAAQIGLQKKQLIEHIRNFYYLMDISTSWETSSEMRAHMQKKQLIKQIRTFFCGRLTNNHNSTSSVDETQKSSGSSSNRNNDDSLHILHEYIKYKTQIGAYSPSNGDMMWSATELYEGGVKFSKSESDSFKDISFDPSTGVLSLPPIEVGDNTEALLLNLMAFEHLHVGAGNAVTAYVILMDTLIDLAKDVELLRTKEIVKGLVGSDENVAKIFNRISDETVRITRYNPNGVENQLCHYRNNRLHKWRASFVHTYLSNPWVFSSLIGALILLVLTVLQDVYTVLPYYTK